MQADPRHSQQAGSETPEMGAAEFEALLNAAVDGIIVTDDSGRIVRVNRAAEEMFGYRIAELADQRIDVIMNPRDARAHETYMSNYMRTGQRKIIGIGREVVARHQDGTEFPVALSIGEARLGDERRFVGLIRDLTAQKAAEAEALRQREQMNHVSRLTTMGEMAAAMAHELNQPLAAIANYTAACRRMMSQGPGAHDEVLRALGEIGNQAHRAGEIIQRIRDFARSRAVTRHPVKVAELITEVLPLASMDAKANGVDLRILLDRNLPMVIVDPIQIQQVILNLVRNGVDAMQETPARDRRLDLRAGHDGTDRIRIAVTDRGPGVSDEASDNLFTPFFTTKSSGMGMGLAISRSIIAAHGGKLDFENNPVSGATFFLTLPTTVDET
jgi:two-component system sensor kinase FixL